MTKMRSATYAFGALAALMLLPLATARSTISGTVKDSSGAVMAGVKVDAASEALIEKSQGGVVNSGLLQGAETIMLVTPGSRLTPQLNQLDIGIRRSFTFGERYTVKAEAQIFNLINSNVVTAESQTLGSSITPYLKGGPGGVPTAILNPRMLRLAVQFHF
jgi:hypothetical protein